MARCVVTGGSGFIGSAIVKALRSRNISVTVLDRKKGLAPDVDYVETDFEASPTLDDYICGADAIFHFAGKLGTSELNGNTSVAVRSNILGTLSVLDAAAKFKCPVFLACKPNVHLNTYTITKRAAEEFGELYSQLPNGCPVTRLRYFDVYGPGQSLLPIRKVIPNFCLRCLAGKPIEIYGSGKQHIDLIYVDDAAEITVRAWEKGLTGCYEVGTGSPISVCQIADVVKREGSCSVPVRHVSLRHNEMDVGIIAADAAPVLNATGYKPRSFADGIRPTWQYYSMLPAEVMDRAKRFYGI